MNGDTGASDRAIDFDRSEFGHERASTLGGHETSGLPVEMPQIPEVDPILPPPIDSLQIDEMEPPQSPVPVDTPSERPSSSDNVFSSPRASKTSGSPRRWGNNRGGVESSFRARAEEVNTGSKVVPQIKTSPGDFFSIDVEIEAWFCLAGVRVSNWLGSSKTTNSEAARRSRDMLVGSHPRASVAVARDHIVEACTELTAESGWGRELIASLDDFNAQTSLSFAFLSAIQTKKYSYDCGVEMLATFIEQIAASRWDIGLDDLSDDEGDQVNAKDKYVAPQKTHSSRLFVMARMAILSTFGDTRTLRTAKAQMGKAYGSDLKPEDLKCANYASPINYASFMEEIASRYPSYTHHDDDAEHTFGYRLKRMNGGVSKNDSSDLNDNLRYGREGSFEDKSCPPDPRDLVNSTNSAIPFVPNSIIEACALYKSRVKSTPSFLQSYNEYQSPNESQREIERKLMDIPQVKLGWELYVRTLAFQKSFVRVVIDFALQDNQGPNASVHAALATSWHMSRWFECTHVLMFENLSASSFDCQFHLFSHSFCTKHQRLQQYVLEDFPISDFWRQVCGKQLRYDGVPSHTDMESTDLTITLYNKYNLQTFTHLMGICRSITASKTQRSMVVAELPVDPYKSLSGIYEKQLWLQMLQYMKSQVPFTGRRWRYLNMEIISAIYLHVPSQIDDTWLSGSDMSVVMKTAPHEEESSRKIITTFNDKIK